MLGADDGGDDVAAEGRTDLIEQVGVGHAFDLVVADPQVGAVGGQAGAQGAGHARRQVAAGGGGAVEDDLRLEAAHRLGDHAAVGQGEVVVQALVVRDADHIGAVGEERACERPDPGAEDDRPRPHAEPVGQLAGATEQLEADLGRRAGAGLDVDPDRAAA